MSEPTSPERVSIEVSNLCNKGCAFCYNHSNPEGATSWELEELVAFVQSIAAHGTKAVSLGGGEPLQWPHLFEAFARLEGVVYRTMTTNGLLLRDDLLERLIEARPDKVHVSIHFPKRQKEVDRVVEQVVMLDERGVTSGVNLLVRSDELEDAAAAVRKLHGAGVGNERIVYLPVRGDVSLTPTPRDIGQVAGGMNFQSMTCLLACGASPRFVSVGFDKQVSWCSYTSSRRSMPTLDAAGLAQAMHGLPLVFCGTEGRPT